MWITISARLSTANPNVYRLNGGQNDSLVHVPQHIFIVLYFSEFSVYAQLIKQKLYFIYKSILFCNSICKYFTFIYKKWSANITSSRGTVRTALVRYKTQSTMIQWGGERSRLQ